MATLSSEEVTVQQVVDKLDGKETVAVVAAQYSSASESLYVLQAELYELFRAASLSCTVRPRYRSYNDKYKEMKNKKQEVIELGDKLDIMLREERKKLDRLI